MINVVRLAVEKDQQPLPRPREKTPRKNAPFMPVMDKLNAVVSALVARRRCAKR
jgi:hypothetical protein